jgi:osmotically-inducible protein OsmY
MKHLYKLAFILVFGAGLSLAQTGAMGQKPATTPPTFPSGQQQPSTQTTNPDQSPMGQTGTTSTTAITKAQSDIQTALRKQLPASADSVTVSVSDDNKIQLNGTVSSDTEKQQIEQIARSAAPDQNIVNNLKVSGSLNTPPPSGVGNSTSTPPEDKNSNMDQSSPDKTPRPTTRPPMSSSFVESSQTGTQDKSSNMGQGASQGSTNQTPNTQTPKSGPEGSNNAGAAGSTDVQSNIQKAFQQDSSLANANINVNVTGNKIELTGTVTDKEQKKAAKRIAESNAAGYKVVDHLKVEHANDNNSSKPTKY